MEISMYLTESGSQEASEYKDTPKMYQIYVGLSWMNAQFFNITTDNRVQCVYVFHIFYAINILK